MIILAQRYFLMLSDKEALLRMNTALDTFTFAVEGLALVSILLNLKKTTHLCGQACLSPPFMSVNILFYIKEFV